MLKAASARSGRPALKSLAGSSVRYGSGKAGVKSILLSIDVEVKEHAEKTVHEFFCGCGWLESKQKSTTKTKK